MANQYDFFVSFLKYKIMHGEKQVDIHNKTGLSTAWINKIYKEKAKSCPFETQKIIAEYFQLTYDQMIKEGQRLYEAEFPEDRFLGKEEKSEIIDLLTQAISAVEEKEKEIDDLRVKNELYLTIFQNILEGVTFFNERKEFVFSSNRWGFLDNDDVSTSLSFDTLVLKMSKKIANFDEVLDALLLSSKKQEEFNIDVVLKNGNTFHFRVVPIFKEKKFKGSLLINTPKNCKLNQDGKSIGGGTSCH